MAIRKKSTRKKRVVRAVSTRRNATTRCSGVSARSRRGSTAKRHNISRARRNSDLEARKAVEEFENFHWGIPHKRMVKKQIPIGKHLAKLGRITAIEYECEKGNEGLQTYRHDFESIVPVYANAAGNVMLIHGGRMRVKPEGITG